jgi:hypothetical protein
LPVLCSMKRKGVNNMKQILLLSVFALLVFAEFIVRHEPQQVDSKEIPEAVTYSFSKNYPLITEVSWVRDSQYYEARYDARFHENSAVYDRSGNLIATGMRIWPKDLPQAIKDFARTHYPGKRIKKTLEVVFADNNKVSYEIKISGTSLLLDENGNILTTKKPGR